MEDEKENRKSFFFRTSKTSASIMYELSKAYKMSEAAVIRLALKNEYEKFTNKTKGEENE
ncbi:hypothetical protein [Aquitalea pelogenes]|uniref:hypothetical protein n=1 Tax=Aquitalea pelogenes TaxID=1293573 RepID=UPI0035AE7313